MSFCLILLAAGDSKRFNSKTPKPYVKIGGKTLLEYSLIKFSKIRQIKNIIVVINKKHGRYFKKIKNRNLIKITGGKTRQVSTYNALKYIQGKNNNSTIYPRCLSGSLKFSENILKIEYEIKKKLEI